MTKMGLRAVPLCLLPVLPAAAQETPPEGPPPKPAARAETARPRPSHVPLRVQIVIARFEGEKKVANLPFTLGVNAGDGGFTSLRMGVEVPVPITTFATPSKEGSFAPATSFQYRNVGINIDCRADLPDEGRYRIEAKVEQSSVSTPGEKPMPVAAQAPLFRTFNASFKALLRDGQSATHVVATDPVSGESVRIEVGIVVAR